MSSSAGTTKPPPPQHQQPEALVNVLTVVHRSAPLYELDLSSFGRRDDSPHLAQFIAFAALDNVDRLVGCASNSVDVSGLNSVSTVSLGSFAASFIGLDCMAKFGQTLAF